MSYLRTVRSNQAASRLSHEDRFRTNGKAFSNLLAGSQARQVGPLAIMGDDDRGAEPYRHYRHWVFSIINLLSKRAAGQELMLARKSDEPADERDGLPWTKSVASLPPSQRPWKSMKSLVGVAEQEMQIVYQHPLLEFLQKPNPVQSWYEFVYFTMANYNLGGLVYWVWLQDDVGKPEFWALPPWALRPVPPEPGEQVFSRYKLMSPDGVEGEDVDGEFVCRIYLPDPRNVIGAMSPVAAQMDAVKLDDYIQESQKRGFENGIFPQVVVKMGRLGGNEKTGRRRRMSATQRKVVALAIRKMMTGAMRFGEPAIVDGIIEDIVPLSHAPPEMGFKESSELVKSRLCQAFGVSPVLLGDTENPNRASSVVAQDTGNENVINPVLEQISIALSTFVVPQWGDERLSMWIDRCVARDAELDIRRWDVAIRAGAVDDDEVRVNLLNIPARGSKKGISNAQVLTSLLKGFELVGNGLMDAAQLSATIQAALGYSQEAADAWVMGGELPEEVFSTAASMLPGNRRGSKITRAELRDAKVRAQKAGETEVAALLRRFFPRPALVDHNGHP